MYADVNGVQKVLVAGGGAIGRQIAVSVARCGLDATVYDVDPQALRAAEVACRSHVDEPPYASSAIGTSDLAAQAVATQTVGTMRFTDQPEVAGLDADLLIEAIPEKIGLKRQVFQQFSQICPAHTIFTTNTSVLMPSMFVAATGRPSQFAALHFIMDSDLIEIMPHSGTDPATITALQKFAERIGHLAITCRKEQPGHLVNTMLISLNDAALTLAANGVASYEEIDRAWIMATHVDRGPFGLLDLVGLDTALEVTNYAAGVTGSKQKRKNAQFLQQFVDQGRLGMKNGVGFYSYPNPAYQDPRFLTQTQSAIGEGVPQ